ncbi:hypothetical protein CR513_01084, partial [Mucuna pruriens]
MLGTEKPKVVGGDRLDHQRTPADLILNVLAILGEPSSSAMAIVVDGGTTEAKPLVCLHSIEPKSDRSMPRSYRLSFCRDELELYTSELGQLENHDRTLKELATLYVVYQPWCIQYPQLEPAQTYELKSGLIHLLPKFHGLAGEDPYKHLKEFHVVCSTMRPQGIPEDYIKTKAFPFSLDGVAKAWLYLQPTLFNT